METNKTDQNQDKKTLDEEIDEVFTELDQVNKELFDR